MPYAEVILGPKYEIRLHNLTAADCLVAKCFACDKTWRIAPHRLYDRFPPHTPLLDIGRQMKCPCGMGADAILWHVERASVATNPLSAQ